MLQVNSKGRTFVKGKSASEELGRSIIDSVVAQGGDVVSGEVPRGLLSNVANQFMTSKSFVTKLWKQTVTTSDHQAPKRQFGKPRKLTEDDLELVEILKRDRPSIRYREIQQNLDVYSDIQGGISIKALSNAVRHNLTGGLWTFKRLTKVKKEKFTAENLAYCNAFVNYLATVPPNKLKFFDEAGVNLTTSNPVYGHSKCGEPAVEIVRGQPGINVSLNVICGLEGILYSNTVDGAVDTIEFLRFFHECSLNTTHYGSPVLECGDHIIIDNCPTHHYEGGEVLTEWLEEQGIYIIFTPFYSPELNVTEYVFNKLKVVLKQARYRDMMFRNIHAAIFAALNEVSEQDMIGFYRKTEFIDI